MIQFGFWEIRWIWGNWSYDLMTVWSEGMNGQPDYISLRVLYLGPLVIAKHTDPDSV